MRHGLHSASGPMCVLLLHAGWPLKPTEASNLSDDGLLPHGRLLSWPREPIRHRSYLRPSILQLSHVHRAYRTYQYPFVDIHCDLDSAISSVACCGGLAEWRCSTGRLLAHQKEKNQSPNPGLLVWVFCPLQSVILYVVFQFVPS